MQFTFALYLFITLHCQIQNIFMDSPKMEKKTRIRQIITQILFRITFIRNKYNKLENY